MDKMQRRQFVRNHRTCVFGYARNHDGPAMTIVYYLIDGEDIVISTMAERGKAKAVRKNSKVSLCVLDEKWPPTYLQVYGDAQVEEDFDQAVSVTSRVINLMAGKEMPASKLPEMERMCRDEHRVTLRIRPYATFETPPRHVYEASDIDTLTHTTSTSMPW